VTIRLPPGVRDYLPGAAARRRGIAATVAAEIERWGYRGIITPLYEYDAVLSRGLGQPVKAMRFVEPATGEVVALRPDLTPQVARLVATRMHDEPGPLRLYYQGSVVRLDGARHELFQVGVELIDAPQPGGDLEVVALAEAALAALGIGARTVDIGHAALVRAVFDALGAEQNDQAELVRAALARKDRALVAELATATALPPRLRALLCALPSLYGGVEVLERARTLVDGAEQHAALDELTTLVSRLGALGPAERLSIDLGEARGFDYYTGSRFAIFADGAGEALASGGRYDHLVARYGRAARAAGFALDVDRVGELLASRGVAAPGPAGGVLVGGDPVAAALLAAELRRQGTRAVLALDEPALPDQALRAQARARSLPRVVVAAATGNRWLDDAGEPR
jgi:ATP phosphoribosyltransferase regulatory subunit